MTNKYDAPSGAPPAYNSPNPPTPAHVTSPGGSSAEYYGTSPYQQHASPYPQQSYPQQPYPQQPYAQPGYGAQGPYYNQGPPMAYQQQGPGYPQQYGPPQQGGYYGPQGGYINRGGNAGFMEALLASLACCCCLDACLLF